MMYCARPVARSPSVYRVLKSPSTSGAVRNASFLGTPFYHAHASNTLDPLFRMLDDFTSPRSFDLAPAFAHHAFRQSVAGFPNFPAPTFQPRFDVRDAGESYELRGELPGIESENLEVEFSDAQTLTIRGRTERETSSATEAPKAVAQQPEAESAPSAEAEADNSDAASSYSTGSYQKPSVEDGEGEAESSADAQAKAKATPAESTVPTQTQQAAPEQQPQPAFIINERSSGSFQRTFKFPSRIDQEAVKASLKNGVLSIVVPKAAAPVAKRISIE